MVFRRGPDTYIPPNSVTGNLSVACAPGEVAMSGGYFTNTGFAYDDRPSGDGAAWIVLIDNFDSGIGGQGYGYVVCTHA